MCCPLTMTVSIESLVSELSSLVRNGDIMKEIITNLDQLYTQAKTSILTAAEKGIISFKKNQYENSKQWFLVMSDWTWEQLHRGHWKDVPQAYRKLYAVIALMHGLVLSCQGCYNEALVVIDKGLLLGAPILDQKLHTFATVLTAKLNSVTSSTNIGSVEFSNTHSEIESMPTGVTNLDKVEFSTNSTTSWKHKIRCRSYHPITEIYPSKSIKTTREEEEEIDETSITDLYCPSLEVFKEFMKAETPVILRGCMKHWPAMSSNQWSIDYLKRIAGPRTVPVEIGLRYTDEDWSQKLMTISDFIDKYILLQKEPIEKGYMAQHQLFDQIPELQKDICIPDYCCLTLKENDPNEEDVKINAWFGPKGTISPLHHDPQHNLLSQVIGEKYIKLFSRTQTPYLYPHDGLLTNTSQVDVERPDLLKFPLFSQAKSSECYLKSGDMLYIPPQYWHYVRSLTMSFSVSFWWS